MQPLRLGLAPLLLLLPGCLVGGGEGWVTGDLYVAQCNGSSSLDKPGGQFDLDVGFFGGEALQDPNPDPARQLSRLTVRLQTASTTVDSSDGLMIQFRDDAEIARRFVLPAREPLPITEAGLCYGACPLPTDLVRARLYLYNRCPDSRHSLIATNRAVSSQPTGASPTCQVPAAQEASTCGPLTASARASLDELCRGDFKNKGSAEAIRAALGAGGGSCLYLCQFGSAQPGQTAKDLEGFSVDYGERVSGLMSLRVVDGRSIQTGTCAQGLGQLQGMFSLDIQRGTAAQTFP